MDTQEFIDSGTLELYAAGGLSPAQMTEVETRAQQDPAVKAALENALRAMEAYALTHAQPPAPGLEDRILSHIAGLPGHPEEIPASVRPIASAPGRNQPFQRQWQWAAAAVLVISAIGNMYLYRQLREKDQELMTARQQTRQYVFQTNQLEQRQFQTQNLLQALTAPETKTVALQAVAQKEGAGKVFWNPQTQEVFFDQRLLPPAPAGKQYQLWALFDGKPIDAGLIAANTTEVQRMKTIAQAQAFAVTLEPEGGSAAPTLAEMVVSGTI